MSKIKKTPEQAPWYFSSEQRKAWAVGYNHAIESDDTAQRIQQLEGILRGISDFLHTAPAESGVCCCGSPMEGHGYWDGHSPVDMFSHSADRWVTEARAILDAKP